VVKRKDALIFLLYRPSWYCNNLYRNHYTSKEERSDFLQLPHHVSYCFVWVLRNNWFMNMWFVFLCFMSAYACLELTYVLGRTRLFPKLLIAFALILILCFDLVPTLAQKPYRGINNKIISQLNQQLTKANKIGRIFVLWSGRSTLWRSLDVVNTNASSPFGGIPQTSTKTHPYMAAIAAKLSQETLYQKIKPTISTMDCLRLLNIPFVAIPQLRKVLQIKHAFPAWFSLNLKKIDRSGSHLDSETWSSIRPKFEKRTLDFSFTDYVINKMQLDKTRPIAQTFLLPYNFTGTLNNREVSSYSRTDKPLFTILSVKEGHSFFELQFSASSDGYVQLPYSYFPFMDISLDDKPVIPFCSAMNFNIIPVPAGKHEISLKAGISKMRLILTWIAIITFFICLLMLIILLINFKTYRSENKRGHPLKGTSQ
jgi:hypothetical protein